MNETYNFEVNKFPHTEKYFVYFVRLYCFPLTVTFPFYSYVYRQNREREMTTAVFLIIEHFYEILKIFYFFYFFVALWMWFMWDPAYFEIREHTFLEEFIRYLLPITTAPLIMISMTCYTFLAILAVQRFLMYFWPSTEKCVTFNATVVKWMSRFAMVYFLVEACLMGYYPGFLYINFAFNMCLLSSAMLYIPIWFSLRKYRHLVSAQLNQPQRYVLWQLVSLIIFKFIYTPILFVAVDRDPSVVAELIKLVDNHSFPLLIQLSYLGCNRRNLMTLISSFKTSWKLIFCPWVPSSQVGSGETSEETTRATNQPMF